MSNHRNHRRNEERRTEHGPTLENRDPGKGCNSTHVARSRAKWKRRKNRSIRRNGKQTPKFWTDGHGRPIIFYNDEIE